ncbi:MAG TPA: MFS transporter [Polyangiaceae bacterium]|nr:MFS transporter [Polyangiaceae bacterium]
MTRPLSGPARTAFRFVFTMGIVNLFADATYEGGGSINGPFLATLGASAAAISIVAGVGEFLGYALRSASGFVSDRTGKYWLVTFIGYAINLLAVPALALAGSFPLAAACILAERVGRALRKPTVESMLSYTTDTLGTGWVYALNSALDETGSTLGPLLMAFVLSKHGSYALAYALLLVPALLALASLTAARVVFPLPSDFERGRTARAKGFTSAYFLNMVAAALFAAGLVSFELLSFHLVRQRIFSEAWIPIVLAISTVVGIVASLVFGRLYDRVGLPVVLVGVVTSAAFSPFVFFGGSALALVGMSLWGVGYATQDTLFKALIAGLLPEGKRNFAFGLFYAGYGVGWLVGSVVMGLLYERSLAAVVAFSALAQLASVPLFLVAARRQTPKERPA